MEWVWFTLKSSRFLSLVRLLQQLLLLAGLWRQGGCGVSALTSSHQPISLRRFVQSDRDDNSAVEVGNESRDCFRGDQS